MNNIERLEELKDINFDKLVRDISLGKVKSGKYSHLVKVKGKINKEDITNDSTNKNKFWK